MTSIGHRRIDLSVALFATVSLLFTGGVPAQVGTDRIEGLRDHTPRWHALTDVRLVVAPGKVIEHGTLVMKDGVIQAAGAQVQIPAGARVWKLDGRTVYAGFVDLASNVGVPANLRAAPFVLPPQLRAPGAPPPPEVKPLTARAIASRNIAVHAEQEVAQHLEWKAEEVKAARDSGFTSVLAAPSAGVFRGQGALVDLADGTDAKAMVLLPRASTHVSHDAERSFGRIYPNSMMGAIALLRQTFYDARWYRSAQDAAAKGGERPEPNATLDALLPALAGKQPVMYQAGSEQDFNRIAKIRDEFKLRVVAQGNGFEYRQLAQLKASALPVLVPVNFPAAPDVSNPDSALDVPLELLQHWEQAPSNLSRLHAAGIDFAITANGVKDIGKEFWPNLRTAVKRGLGADQALAALTSNPARLIGAPNLGTLEPGKIANVVVASGDLFASDQAEIELTFVDGKPYPTAAYQRFDARGTWSVTENGTNKTWTIAGTRDKPQLAMEGNICELALSGRQLIASFPCGKNPVGDRFNVVAEGDGDSLRGTRQEVDGTHTLWTATRTAPFNEPAKEAKNDPPPALPITYPAGPYGVVASTRPAQVLVRNATLWTSAAAGRIEHGDLLVKDGRIAAVGRNLAAPEGALIIDATGKDVSPGVIDAHSHTAIQGGVNESSSSITAEVRIGDIIDATDINIYRELAGGVTAANVLHGSANSIGGQNQVIKLRWGADAESLKFAGAMPGIKFALGENVKQSNWGSDNNSRYPQTRLGVEQLLRDAFQAARGYRAQQIEWREHGKALGKVEPRRDLQLDTLVEILDKKRVVHIHSYVADEILMFARLSQEFGFTVATFQHVLEGYKVADVLAAIGAGGSTFADWWGYKMEAFDAIPANGALMHRAGVVVTFNSDSDELARHLNTEAAKAIKYGGVAPVEALKFVTLNAAKQLRIDDRVGSLEVGKDADFVIWNTSPLSSNARAEQTWIEGKKYFDREADAAMRVTALKERERLVAKALAARPPRPAGPPGSEPPPGAPPTAADMAAVTHWLQHAAAVKHDYWDGEAWHECTGEQQ